MGLELYIYTIAFVMASVIRIHSVYLLLTMVGASLDLDFQFQHFYLTMIRQQVYLLVLGTMNKTKMHVWKSCIIFNIKFAYILIYLFTMFYLLRNCCWCFR